MAGYSGTPLPKKLGIKEHFREAFVDTPANVKSELKDAWASCTVVSKGPFDYVHLFVKSQLIWKKRLRDFTRNLPPQE